MQVKIKLFFIHVNFFCNFCKQKNKLRPKTQLVF